MQISSGTQLVWFLSGSEAVNLGMPKIEPDHLYCALLKFVELDEATIARLLSNSSDVPSACDERDDLASEFKNLPGSTTEIRHALRKETEHGTHNQEGVLIHRSDASRKIFEKAIEITNDEDVPVYPTHLLQALMESPTPAMKKVLKLDEIVPKWMQDLEQAEEKPEKARQYPNFIQPVQDLAPSRGFSVPATSKPQLKVIEDALCTSSPSPLLLICESGIDPLALMWKVYSDSKDNLTLLKVDHTEIVANLDEQRGEDVRCREISLFTEEMQKESGSWIFFDLSRETPDEEYLLKDLIALLPKQPHIILAVSEKTFWSKIRADEAAEAGFRSIWLHDLSTVKQISHV